MFDHTADLGMRVEADSLNLLFQDAAVGLTSMIVEHPRAIREIESQRVQMFDWLAELLFQFEANGWIGSRFEVQIEQHELTATAFGEPYDSIRHQPAHEVKAISYHGLFVKQIEERWTAELIVGI